MLALQGEMKASLMLLSWKKVQLQSLIAEEGLKSHRFCQCLVKLKKSFSEFCDCSLVKARPPFPAPASKCCEPSVVLCISELAGTFRAPCAAVRSVGAKSFLFVGGGPRKVSRFDLLVLWITVFGTAKRTWKGVSQAGIG